MTNYRFILKRKKLIQKK